MHSCRCFSPIRTLKTVFSEYFFLLQFVSLDERLLLLGMSNSEDENVLWTSSEDCCDIGYKKRLIQTKHKFFSRIYCRAFQGRRLANAIWRHCLILEPLWFHQRHGNIHNTFKMSCRLFTKKVQRWLN